MTRQFGSEQWHRNGPGLDRCIEAGDIVDTLWREDRNPITTACELLQLPTDGLQSDTELGPGHFDGMSLSAGVVQVAIRHGVTDIRDIAVDQRYQGGTWRQDDAAVGIQAVFDQ